MTVAEREVADVRVVVVDDEPDVRLLLRFQLERHGFDVVGEATDGTEAIAVCAAEQPDAAVVDLLMPGMSGIEAIPVLQEAHPRMGIVAYTAVAGEFVRERMAALGVTLLLKSGDPAPLVAALSDFARA